MTPLGKIGLHGLLPLAQSAVRSMGITARMTCIIHMMTPRAPSSAEQPMEEVATNIYDVGSRDWLVMVECFSRVDQLSK